MRKFFPPTAAVLATLALGASALAGAGEEPRPPPYNLLFEGSLPEATVLNVAVDAKGVEPIALTLTGGKVLNGVSIPGEGRRHVVVNAQNPDGKVIYEGSFDIEIGMEITPQVSVELESAIDGTRGELTLASHRGRCSSSRPCERDGKLLTRLTGNVFDANGRRLEIKPEAISPGKSTIRRSTSSLSPCPASFRVRRFAWNSNPESPRTRDLGRRVLPQGHLQARAHPARGRAGVAQGRGGHG